MKKVLWIDTETTGLNPKIHGLREVAYLIEIDGAIVEKGELSIDPMTYREEKYISEYVEKVMGVTKESLDRNGSSLHQNLTFSETLTKHIDVDDKKDHFVIAGYNVDFDYNFLEAWFEDCMLPNSFRKLIGYQKLDVLQLVRNLKYLDKFETPNHKLETMCDYFKIEINAHNALSDIEATKKLHSILAVKYIK